jgi:hypothetical protein
MLTIMYRRLDRVNLVRRYHSPAAHEEFLGTLGVANVHAENGFLKKLPLEHSTKFIKAMPGKDWPTDIQFRFFSVQGKPAIAITNFLVCSVRQSH